MGGGWGSPPALAGAAFSVPAVILADVQHIGGTGLFSSGEN